MELPFTFYAKIRKFTKNQFTCVKSCVFTHKLKYASHVCRIIKITGFSLCNKMQPNQNKLKVTKLVIITNNDFLIVIFPKVWLV